MRSESQLFDAAIHIEDRKYVVLQRSDFEELELPADIVNWIEQLTLTDATVIRGQDRFSAAALHTYANSIAIAADLTKDETLLEIADYFHLRAVQADLLGKKLPD